MSVLPVIALIEAIPQVDYYLCETVYITSGLFWDIFGKVLGYALSCLTLLVEMVVGGHIFYMKYFFFLIISPLLLLTQRLFIVGLTVDQSWANVLSLLGTLLGTERT